MACFPTDFPKKKASKDLPERAIKFIGRQKYLNEIKSLFEDNQILAVCNYGGVGKTTLALEYCNTLIFEDPEANIRWFNSDSSENIKIQYKRLAKLLDINEDKDMDYIVQKTNMKLREFKKNILFVFDSLEKYDYIEKYVSCIPNKVKILITTRDQLEHYDLPKLKLMPFELNEAYDYIDKNLKVKLNKSQKEKIIQLVKTSQNEIQILPIKIEKIISILNYWYYEDIDKCLQKIINNNYLNFQVEYTLFFNFEIAEEKKTKKAFEMLQYLSLLNPDFIPIEIFNSIIENNLKDWIDIKDCIEILNSLSLVSVVITNDKTGVQIHRLIQNEIKSYAENNKNDKSIKQNKIIHKNMVKCLNKVFEKVDEDPKKWAENEQYYLQALSLYENNSEFIEDCEETIELVDKLYHYEYYSDNNHTNLLDRAFKLYEMGRRVYGDVHSFIAKYLTSIAIGYELKKDSKNALIYYLKAHEMNQKLYGNVDHPETGKSLNNLGIAYFLVKDFEKSLEYYKQALSIREKLNESKNIAESLNNVGVGYDKINDFNNALEYKLKALEMYKRIYSNTDHSDLATALNNVGISYDKINNFEKALEYKHKGLEMRKQLYKNIHSNTAESLQSVANTYFRMDKFENALEYFFKEYEMYLVMQKNDDTSEIAESLKNIGDCYERLGDFENSLNFRLNSLEIYTKCHKNQDHTDIVESLKKVGDSYDNIKEVDKSLTFKLKATEMSQRLNKEN